MHQRRIVSRTPLSWLLVVKKALGSCADGWAEAGVWPLKWLLRHSVYAPRTHFHVQVPIFGLNHSTFNDSRGFSQNSREIRRRFASFARGYTHVPPFGLNRTLYSRHSQPDKRAYMGLWLCARFCGIQHSWPPSIEQWLMCLTHREVNWHKNVENSCKNQAIRIYFSIRWFFYFDKFRFFLVMNCCVTFFWSRISQ